MNNEVCNTIQDYVFQVNENGFHEQIIRIPRGRSITFKWRDTIVQHAITEYHYCARHHGLIKTDIGLASFLLIPFVIIFLTANMFLVLELHP